MQNFIQPGDTITMTAPYNVASGAGAKVGTMFGVASGTYLSGAPGEFSMTGVFDLAKATGAAWTEGAAIYWDDSAKNCTTTSSGNTKIGVATVNVAGTLPQSADTVGRVRLNGAF